MRSNLPTAQFEEPAARLCPLCGGRAGGEVYPYGTRWDQKLFRNLGCGACGSSFIDPVPTPSELERFYSRSDYHDEFYRLEDQNSQTSLLDRIWFALPHSGNLLDYGCGNGNFLKLARDVGFRVTGVEIDRETCRLATANSGCPVDTVQTFDAGAEKFDMIHLGDVLEHVPDPAATMRRLQRRLATGGRFFVEGPLEDNASVVFFASRAFGFAKRLGGRRYGSYLPLHLYRATADAQLRFFTETLGLRVLAYHLSDDGWPYAARNDSFLRPRSAGHLVKLAIARVSQVTSRIAVLCGLTAGNRFAAVLALESPDGSISHGEPCP